MEAGTGNLGRVWDEVHLYRDSVRKTKVKLELQQITRRVFTKVTCTDTLIRKEILKEVEFPPPPVN